MGLRGPVYGSEMAGVLIHPPKFLVTWTKSHKERVQLDQGRSSSNGHFGYYHCYHATDQYNYVHADLSSTSYERSVVDLVSKQVWPPRTCGGDSSRTVGAREREDLRFQDAGAFLSWNRCCMNITKFKLIAFCRTKHYRNDEPFAFWVT